jgi:hypothetical protein
MLARAARGSPAAATGQRRSARLAWRKEVIEVQAAVGERLLVHGNKVGATDVAMEIIEVRGDDGAPPYLVRYPDGHEGLVFPGSDCTVEHGRAAT